jgi:hypothetical protein
MSEPANKNASHKKAGAEASRFRRRGIKRKTEQDDDDQNEDGGGSQQFPRAELGPEFLGENYAGGLGKGSCLAFFPLSRTAAMTRIFMGSPPSPESCVICRPRGEWRA